MRDGRRPGLAQLARDGTRPGHRAGRERYAHRPATAVAVDVPTVVSPGGALFQLSELSLHAVEVVRTTKALDFGFEATQSRPR